MNKSNLVNNLSRRLDSFSEDDIERSINTFWAKKGHLLCSSCLDEIEKNQKKPTMKLKVNLFIKNDWC